MSAPTSAPMPVTLPHPDDFARLDWRTRDRAIRTARGLLRAYGGTVAEDMTTDGYRTAREMRDRADRAWGERERAEARRIAGGGLTWPSGLGEGTC